MRQSGPVTADKLARVDNRLAYVDQASYAGLEALGYAPVIQTTWIYDRPVDIDGLRRFHHHLGGGLLGRLIERSPVPGGSHHWVSAPSFVPLVIEPEARPREEVWDWAVERVHVPIDPAAGPGWHLALQPLTNGGGAVTLTSSHSLADGLGLFLSVAEAVNGVGRNLGYPPPRSRGRRQALIEDGRHTARAIPKAAKAALAGARVARTESDGLAASVKPPRREMTPGADRPVIAPHVTVFVEVDHWDARCKALDGTSNSLFAGLAAKLGQMLGRVDGSGKVRLSWPVGDRTDGDTRANALLSAFVTADPADVTESLAELRAEIKRALIATTESKDALLAPLPLVPFIPKPVARVVAKMINSAGSPVGCSNIGDLDPAANRPDGTDAAYICIRMHEHPVTTHTLDRNGGILMLVSGRVHGKIFVTVSAWTPGGPNTKEGVVRLVRQALDEFGVDGIVE
jgi:diacylglycerol O-acyltransferase / wax synthase